MTNTLEMKKALIPGPLWGNYFSSCGGGGIQRNIVESDQVILLLHGFAESGEYFYRKLKSHLPPDAFVISPNGPFFMPIKTSAGYRAGYSWYFYDAATDEYVVDMTAALNYIDEIFKMEGAPSAHQLTVIGYSQGGYLAPFVGLRMATETKRVVGLSCQFLVDEFSRVPQFEMVAIHGTRDESVGYLGAKQSVEKLKQNGVDRISLHSITGGGHRLKTEHLEILKNVLSERTS